MRKYAKYFGLLFCIMELQLLLLVYHNPIVTPPPSPPIPPPPTATAFPPTATAVPATPTATPTPTPLPNPLSVGLSPLIYTSPPPSHTFAINSVAYSPDGKMLATVSSDETLKVWEVSSGKMLKSFPAETALSVAFSPDNKTVASGGWNGIIKLWDVASQSIVYNNSYNATKSKITTTLISSDGEWLITGHEDSTVKIWRIFYS
jgi:WD40 repeat protein